MSLNSPSTPISSGFAPVFSLHARVLILGTLPGKTSLAREQYYGHPHNAFWRILSQLFAIPVDAPYETRCAMAVAQGLAIWDVCHSAQRLGSLDSQIVAASIVANPIPQLLAECPDIRLIALNGQAAASLFKKHISPTPAIETLALPSTSPANASLRFEQKLEKWQMLKQYLD